MKLLVQASSPGEPFLATPELEWFLIGPYESAVPSERASNNGLFGEPNRQAADRGFESTVSSFQEAIRDCARQEGPADFSRRRLPVHGFPALTECVDTELRQARDFRS